MTGLAVFFAGMAMLQAWPSQGFWHSASDGEAHDALGGMSAGTAPPGLVTRMLNGFGNLQQSHAFAVNLTVVALLAALGAGIVIGTARHGSRPWLLRAMVVAAVVACLADWVFVENLGVLGGLGTDPDSMPPLALLVAGGYLTLVKVPELAVSEPGTTARLRDQARPSALYRAAAGAPGRAVASLAGAGMLVAGAVPAVVSARTAADPVLARSLASANAVLDYPAAPFRLTDQSGRSVSLTGLRGKVVLLAFLDPHCGSDCPPLAQEFGRVDQILGQAAKQIELVAIAASSGRSAVADTAAFTRRERLSQVQNWLFLTGSTSQLHEVWRNYAIAVPAPGPGTPAGHSDIALIIDPAGQVRSRLEDDQALWTSAGEESFASLLVDTAISAG